MVEIPEDLLRRSAEAKAKALGVPVEQVLAEMRGEAPPSAPPDAEDAPPAPKPQPGASADLSTPPGGDATEPPAAVAEIPASAEGEVPVPEGSAPDTGEEPESIEAGQVGDSTPPPATEMAEESTQSVATATEEPPAPPESGDGAANGEGGNG